MDNLIIFSAKDATKNVKDVEAKEAKILADKIKDNSTAKILKEIFEEIKEKSSRGYTSYNYHPAECDLPYFENGIKVLEKSGYKVSREGYTFKYLSITWN